MTELEATNYCENVKYVKKLDKYAADLQRDFKALTSKLPVLLNCELINKDDLLDLEISMDDLAIQIQSALFKVQQLEDSKRESEIEFEKFKIKNDVNNDCNKNNDCNENNDKLVNKTIKDLMPLFFTYLMAVDKNSIINKKEFCNSNKNYKNSKKKNNLDSLLQNKTAVVGNTINNSINNNSINNNFIPFIELD